MGGEGSMAHMIQSLRFNRGQLKEKISNFKKRDKDLTGLHLKLNYPRVSGKRLSIIKRKIKEQARKNLLIQVLIWVIFTAILIFLVTVYVIPFLF